MGLDIKTLAAAKKFVSNSEYVKKEEGKGLSTNDYTAEDKRKLDGLNGSDYVEKTGDVMTGGLILAANHYYENGMSGLDARNSDIVSVNSIYFETPAETAREGISFPRSISKTNFDTIHANNGHLYFTPNRPFKGNGVPRKVYTEVDQPTTISNNTFTTVTGGGPVYLQAVKVDVGNKKIAVGHDSDGTKRGLFDPDGDNFLIYFDANNYPHFDFKNYSDVLVVTDDFSHGVVNGGAENSIIAGEGIRQYYAGVPLRSGCIIGTNLEYRGGNVAMFGHATKQNNNSGAMDGTGTTDAFIIGNGKKNQDGSITSSNAARIDYNGKLWCKQAYSATGADYAEYFEWEDGNPDHEDRRGYFVTLNGDKIRKANKGDWILGVVSGNPCVIGNTDTEWQGQFMRDEFGAFIKEIHKETVKELSCDEAGNPILDENGNQIEIAKEADVEFYKVNPDYDPDKEYIFRDKRKEWDTVGMVGVLPVRDDGTCMVNGFCQCVDGGIATASETGYRVIKRVTDNIINVIFR